MMSNLYKCVNYENLVEGEMILAFGCHAISWDFDSMGEPSYGFVPICENDLTATIAEKDAEIERLRYALMDIDSYVDDESKIGRIIRNALEVNDES